MASQRFAGISALTLLAVSSLAVADSTLTLDLTSSTANSANKARLSVQPEWLVIAGEGDSNARFVGESVNIDFSETLLQDAAKDSQSAASRLGLLPPVALDAASGRVPQSVVVDALARPIIAGVSIQADGALQAYLARYTTEGLLDTSFGAGTGSFFVPLTQPVFGNIPSCKSAVTSEDRLVLACIVDNGADMPGYAAPQLIIARFSADGTLDRSEQPTPLTINGIKGPASVRVYSATADGSGDSNNAVAVDVPIRTPDSFSFTSQNGVPLSTLITSNTVTITGITGSGVVTVSGGQYSIGCTQTFTSAPSPISEGDQLCVRLTSSATNGLPTTLQLTVTVTYPNATTSTSGSFTATTVGATSQSGGGGGGALDRWSLLGLAVLGAVGASRGRRRIVAAS